jgi:PAS domain-containing protein
LVDPSWLAVAAAAGAGLAWLFKQPGAILLDLRRELEAERKWRKEAIGERDEAATALAECRMERAQLREVAGRLSRGADRLLEADALDDALDHAKCGIVVSSADNGGTWEWVSQSCLDDLGIPRENRLRLDWRRLIHPDELRRTQAVEGAAWGGPVRGYATRYRRADGTYSQWRWWCSGYRGGRAICVVWFERTEMETD